VKRSLPTAVALLSALLPLAHVAQEASVAAPIGEPPAVVTADAATALRDALAELERAYASAIAAHAAGEFEASIRKLRAVVEALEALPEGAEPFARWTRTMLRLARSEQELGRRAEALEVLGRLLRAAPDAKADARQFPPGFLALLEEARARRRTLDAQRLAVAAAPEPSSPPAGREPEPTIPLVPEPPAAELPSRGALMLGRGGVQDTPKARDGSRRYGWAALGTGAATVVAAGASLYFALSASGSYADARAMLDGSDRLRPGLSVLEYNASIRDGDQRRDVAIGAGIASGVGLAATAVLSWVSYRRTGEIGPLRF